MAEKTLKSKIQLRNDTAANWTTTNPVLLKGEVGIEIDTRKFKIGDGTSTWSSLSYANITNLSNYYTMAQTTDQINSAVNAAKTSLETTINNKVSTVYKYKGSLTPSTGTTNPVVTLPTNASTGDVYNVTDTFVTTSEFVEGAGKRFGAGANIVYGGSETNGKWDVLGGLADLTGYATTTQLQTGLETKVDKVSGKSLSTNDFTDTYKNQIHSHSNISALNSIEAKHVSAIEGYITRNTKIIDTDDVVILDCGSASGN